jgi:signal transduction histidine kinase
MIKSTDNKAAKPVLVIIVTSIIAVLLFAYLSYVSSRTALLSQMHTSNLDLAHTYRGYAMFKAGDSNADEVLQHLHSLWKQSGSSFSGAYLSVVGIDGRLMLHTRSMDLVGSNISNRILQSASQRTVKELLNMRQDYSGPYMSLAGQQQLAAFTYVPTLDAFIAVHVPYQAVQTRLDQSGLLWLAAVPVMGAGMLPLFLLFFYRAYAFSRDSSADSVRSPESAIAARKSSDSRPVEQQRHADASADAKILALQARNKVLEHNYQHELEREKRHRFQLLEEKEVAERASRCKTEFLFRLNHELRTPLHAIVGFTQLLQQTPLNPDQKENLDEIYVAGQYLQKLVSDVLELSMIESGRTEMILKPVAIDELSDECIKMLGSLADARNISFHAYNDRSGRYWVDADRTRLQQVIINLLGNAIKYSREGSEVSVEIHGYTRRVVYLVRDAGPGLNKQQVEELFIPLQHLQRGIKNTESTGIGLAICHALVEQMNGKIKVTSVPGVGSVFQLEFPLSVIHSDSENIQKIIDIRTPGYSKGQEYTLLYVDDNASNLGFMRQLILNRPELHFIATTDPEQCIDLVRTHSPDIIVLDLHMDETCASKLFVQLKSDPAATVIPIVAINANIHLVTKADMENMQFRAFCAEPLDAKEFNQTLDRVLSGCQ